MERKVRKQPTGFTQVTNLVLNDPTISWKAKGIYAYIYSKPDGWDFSARRIAKDARDGNDGTISGIQELEEAGYIKRERHGDGRVTYHVLVDPNTENPEVASVQPNREKPKEGKAHSGKSPTVSNKEEEIIKSINNKDSLFLVLSPKDAKKVQGIVLPPAKALYGELENVVLDDNQYKKLGEKLGEATRDELIEELSYYIPNGKRKYKDHYAAINAWASRKKKEATSRHKSFSVIG